LRDRFTKENQKELSWKAALDKAADRPKERWAVRDLALCDMPPAVYHIAASHRSC